MGFSDGFAAFEARQEAARKKVAAAVRDGGAQQPVSAFDKVMADTKRDVQAKADAEAWAEAEGRRRDTAANVKMAELSAEFGRRADAIGYRPLTVVTGRMDNVQSLFGRSKSIYRFIELIGEGWYVSDPDSLSEWGSVTTSYLVMRNGPWINMCSSSLCSGEARGLPRGMDQNRVKALDASKKVPYVTHRDLRQNVDEILAKALIRAEQRQD